MVSLPRRQGHSYQPLCFCLLLPDPSRDLAITTHQMKHRSLNPTGEQVPTHLVDEGIRVAEKVCLLRVYTHPGTYG